MKMQQAGCLFKATLSDDSLYIGPHAGIPKTTGAMLCTLCMKLFEASQLQQCSNKIERQQQQRIRSNSWGVLEQQQKQQQQQEQQEQ